jgi:hypothetical protein
MSSPWERLLECARGRSGGASYALVERRSWGSNLVQDSGVVVGRGSAASQDPLLSSQRDMTRSR